jgi:hypothetical protein
VFDFDCAIEEGTYDDFKECVLAIVYLERIVELHLTSTPISGMVHRLNARWVQETDQELQAMYDIRAEAVLVDALRNALNHEVQGRTRRRVRRTGRRNREVVVW